MITEKICGRKEPCFIFGECWGHAGSVLCTNLIENKEASICYLDGKKVLVYVNEKDYKNLTKKEN